MIKSRMLRLSKCSNSGVQYFHLSLLATPVRSSQINQDQSKCGQGSDFYGDSYLPRFIFFISQRHNTIFSKKMCCEQICVQKNTRNVLCVLSRNTFFLKKICVQRDMCTTRFLKKKLCYEVNNINGGG